MNKKLSAKQRMLNTLKRKSHNTFSVEVARERFGVKNVAARIDELRKDGHSINTVSKKSQGKTVRYYKMAPATSTSTFA